MSDPHADRLAAPRALECALERPLCDDSVIGVQQLLDMHPEQTVAIVPQHRLDRGPDQIQGPFAPEHDDQICGLLVHGLVTEQRLVPRPCRLGQRLVVDREAHQERRAAELTAKDGQSQHHRVWKGAVVSAEIGLHGLLAMGLGQQFGDAELRLDPRGRLHLLLEQPTRQRPVRGTGQGVHRLVGVDEPSGVGTIDADQEHRHRAALPARDEATSEVVEQLRDPLLPDRRVDEGRQHDDTVAVVGDAAVGGHPVVDPVDAGHPQVLLDVRALGRGDRPRQELLGQVPHRALDPRQTGTVGVGHGCTEHPVGAVVLRDQSGRGVVQQRGVGRHGHREGERPDQRDGSVLAREVARSRRRHGHPSPSTGIVGL